jgi:signal transduction histidine kinase
LIHPVIFQDKLTGYVYIRSDLHRLYARLRQYVLIIILALFTAFVVAMLASSIFRRAIAQPVMRLAETARIVSREKNYSVRASPTREHDELATLIAAFNEMLEQIQTRDQALREAQGELERRVQDRTRQLVAANKELEAFSYSVSHDLRAPLEVINGFSYVLEMDHGNKLDAGGRECLKQVRMASQRMGELIEDLLNLSRVATTTMHQERVDLSAVARHIADDLRRREPERDVTFAILVSCRSCSRICCAMHGSTHRGIPRRGFSSASRSVAVFTCTSCATMERASIRLAPVACSSHSNGCTLRPSSPATASALQPCSASFTSTEAKSGPPQLRNEEQRFTSRSARIMLRP